MRRRLGISRHWPALQRDPHRKTQLGAKPQQRGCAADHFSWPSSVGHDRKPGACRCQFSDKISTACAVGKPERENVVELGP
jgi:hypothetical protein